MISKLYSDCCVFEKLAQVTTKMSAAFLATIKASLNKEIAEYTKTVEKINLQNPPQYQVTVLNMVDKWFASIIDEIGGLSVINKDDTVKSMRKYISEAYNIAGIPGTEVVLLNSPNSIREILVRINNLTNRLALGK